MCLLLLLLLLGPRIVLALLWFFTGYLSRAYHGFLILLLGFIFLPLTTLVYAWMANNHVRVEGINLIILVVAVVIDLGAHGGGLRRSRRN